MTNIREELAQKLDTLSTEQLNSVRQFVEFLEYKQQPVNPETPLTNEDIDKIVESYRKHNKPRPIGLAKGEFVVPDDFNNPLPEFFAQLTREPEISRGVRQPGSAIGTLKIWRC